MTAICASGLSSVAVAQTPLETWSGAEAFRKAWGLYAGATVAPVAWFDPDVRMRVVTGQSVYRYEAATGASQRGMSPFADVLLGLQKQWGALTVKGFAGVAALADVRTQAEAADLWHHTRLGPKVVLAHFGDLHPATLKALDAEGPLAAFEIFLDALPAEKKKSRAKPQLAAADLLPVTRDFAFVVPKDVAAGDVIKAASGADKALICGVNVFDVFEGGTLAAEGKKSIAIEVTLQPTTETLTDKAIDAVAAKIVADVKKATGGEIRG